ncbi:hypothetical protein VQ042_00205 [Aurantimonas sp. A2-1-M11]|uniref:hypothetical protein n=1 Tax=Aurantimonas sp. A2-1-M11 TaxID=3113712 RepID=UPI002F94A669
MTTSSHNVANSPWMRLVALVIAIALGVLAFLIWTNTGEWVPGVQERGEALGDLRVDADVAACLDKRFADIAVMVEQDLITAEAAEKSRTDARSLCYQRN